MHHRQITGPREVAIAVAYDGAIVADPAIDIESSDLARYWGSLFDLSCLTMTEPATLYTIRPATRAQKRNMPQSADVMDRADWMIRCCVTGIRNRPMIANGVETPTPQPVPVQSGRLGAVAPESWLDDIQLADSETLALYQMIMHISEALGPLSSSSSNQHGDTASCEQETKAPG